MPDGSFRQVAVQCPFYKSDDGKQMIKCEGFGDARSFSQSYRLKADYEKQMEVFCCGYYHKCEVYQLLMETKYDKEDTVEIKDAYEIKQAAPDSQWRLTACDCGNDQPVYVRIFNADGNLEWKAMCLSCGIHTDGRFVRHDAQQLWNQGNRIPASAGQ